MMPKIIIFSISFLNYYLIAIIILTNGNFCIVLSPHFALTTMTSQLLLVLAVIFGLFWSIKARDKKSIVITTGLSLGVLLVLTPISYFKTLGLAIYITFSIIAFIYGLTKNGFKPIDRFIISTITLPIFAYWIFALFHFPGANIIKLLMFFPVAGFIIAAFQNQNLKSELGFLLILAVDAITLILN